jgi:hypothetical protein
MVGMDLMDHGEVKKWLIPCCKSTAVISFCLLSRSASEGWGSRWASPQIATGSIGIQQKLFKLMTKSAGQEMGSPGRGASGAR